MSVIECRTNSGDNNLQISTTFEIIKNIIAMPVVSAPHRYSSSTSSSSTLTGSYRPTISLDRPYYSSSTGSYIVPRSTTTSYLRSGESRLYSRRSEDSGSSRYSRSESRESSVLRKNNADTSSSSRSSDSGLFVSGRRLSALAITESVEDLRQKYSPSNYIPNTTRKIIADNKVDFSRSKSISNDIGKPPVDKLQSTTDTRPTVRKNKNLSTSPRLNRSSIASTTNGTTGGGVSTTSNIRGSSVEKYREDKASAAAATQQYTIKNLGLNGLRNIGNTCFMNSVIQCLSNTRFLLEYLRDSLYLNDINNTTSSMKGALVKAFANVIQELWGAEADKVVNTTALKSQIQRFAPRFMGYAQQDAQEFLRYLLEGLHEDVNRVTVKPTPILTEIDDNLSDSQKAQESWNRYLRMDNSSIVDIFVGQLKSTLKCSVCGYCSVTFDPFWDLSLPLTGCTSIFQCLENFTREETMDGHEKPTCSKCQTRRKCTKSFSIQKFPKILVLHLKRFSPNERFRGKLTTLIDFPLQNLDLSAFAANKGTSTVYNLYAISNHSGTTYSGHYTAYCKHPYSGDWHEYNDSRVSSISPRNVISSEAYVLFYEQIGHSSTSHL